MLSKSKGQVLRVAEALHVLSHIELPDCEEGATESKSRDSELETSSESKSCESELKISNEISERAIKAAINFVGLCCQQTACIIMHDWTR